ncbi:MAG: sulfotransferase family protein [Bacteroidota bacterium]
MSTSLRVFLWSGPRNVSTALMYSFAQRSDSLVVDEPLYAHYLRVSGAEHPAREVVIASQNSNGIAVMKELTLSPYSKQLLFVKHMAHHLVDLDLQLLLPVKNILLIRHPGEVLNSFSKIIDQPILRDIGIKRQAEVYQWLEEQGEAPMVLDGNEVLKDPSTVLNGVCQELGIPFETNMLQWKAGPRPEDGIWAPHWYSNVHRSTGFQAYQPKSRTVRPDLEAVLKAAMPHYEFLFSKSIKA